MGTPEPRSRFYPQPCLSEYCGRGVCPRSCEHLAELLDFKRWLRATRAKRPDPIYCPTFWERGDL